MGFRPLFGRLPLTLTLTLPLTLTLTLVTYASNPN